LISAGDCEAVSLVLEEINAWHPDLKTWAGAHSAVFVPLRPAVQLEAAAIGLAILTCSIRRSCISPPTRA
jgi:hypothetical protein